MALKVTEFDRSVKHRVVLNDDCDETVATNVVGGPGLLKTIIINNVQGSAINYVRCANGSSSTIGADEIRVSVPCDGREKKTVEFPDGIPFNRGISLWCSSDADPSGNTAPAVTVTGGKVLVTLVVS